nr:putative reverse transcriptase domain-containing protein [Tanacetum cinerariifolium]
MQPLVIDDLCVRMSNLEYRHGELVKKMEIVSDTEAADSIATREIHPRVTTLEGKVQTLQTSLHGAWLQNQQLQTRLSVKENREGTLISYMSWMGERLVVLEKRLTRPPIGPRWIELLSDYECEIKYHPGKGNVVADALSRKERLKPRRVRAMSITIHFGFKTKILEVQGEASNDLKAPVEWLRGLETHFERRDKGGIYFFDRIWIPSVGGVRKLIMDEAYTSRYLIHLEKIIQIKERLKTARSRQKSYADNRRKPLEFKVRDRVLLKVSPWKGVVRFEPIKIIERDVKKLKRRRIPLVKVHWNSRQGAEYTWKREDQFRKKYPHPFAKPVPSSSVAT